MWTEYTIGAAVVLVLIALVRGSLVYVRAEEAVVIERGGKFRRCLRGGWHFVAPLLERRRRIYWRSVETGLDGKERMIDRSTWRVDLRPTHFTLPALQVATADQVPFQVAAAWSVAVAEPQIAAYADTHLPRAVTDAAAGVIQQQIAAVGAEALLKDLAGPASGARAALAGKLSPLGLRLCDLEFTSALPAEEIRVAIEGKIAAATNREAAALAAEAAAQTALEEGKAKHQLEIMAAETKRRVMALTSEAEAEAIRRIAAEVENPETARHALAIRYIEVLRQLAGGTNAKTIFIPYDAAVSTGPLDLIRQSLETKQDT